MIDILSFTTLSSIIFFRVFKKIFFLLVVVINFNSANAQKLIDYLDQATKNYQPSLGNNLLTQNNATTELEFGYFLEQQSTISGAQRAYVSFLQELPWLGKSAAIRKFQKYTLLQERYNNEQQKEVLKFKVKQLYYELYKYKHQKNTYVILTDKLRNYIEASEKDTLSTSAKAILKLFERKQQLIELTEKLQLIDGDYENTALQFNTLLKQDSFQEIKLPLELAMPSEDQTISFSDTYESPLFLSYENQLKANRQIQKYNNKWLPTLSLGLRYIDVESNASSVTQLPVQNIVEPRLQLKWNLFSKNKEVLSKQELETNVDQKVLDISSLLQEVINEQVSARISYFSASDRLDQLVELKNQLLEKNVSLDTDEYFQLEYLEATYELEKVKAVSNYFISSSKMLLYQ